METNPISPVSLNLLPQPCDISAAVQQALKLDGEPLEREMQSVVQTGTQEQVQCQPANECEAEKEAIDMPPEEELDELLPDLVTGDILEESCNWENVALPEMDTDFWNGDNSTNMADLEKFCKYIDGEEEEEMVATSNKRVAKGKATKSKCVRQLVMPPSKSTLQSTRYLTWHLELANAALWRKFHSIGTEMVITKNGRRMFPSVGVTIRGLDPDALYSVIIDILPADDRRYKFMQTEWVPVGKIEKKSTYREYSHPESPNTGAHWMDKPVFFKFIKLTNNKATVYNDQVILNSMQKYQPTVKIVCESEEYKHMSSSFTFPETAFIGVTAYQNSRITQLKIDNNPYARAFRDSESGEVEKKGKHCSKMSKSPSSASVSPVRPIRTQTRNVQHGGGSATSVESGFESCGSSSEVLYPQMNWLPTIPTQPSISDSPYGCQVNYWADENSLYNSALIYPPPLLDAGMSFTEPYLHQVSRMVLESQEVTVSPIKLFHPQCNTTAAVSQHHPPPSNIPLIIDISHEETNDDVFV